jgi:hypothetical protein
MLASRKKAAARLSKPTGLVENGIEIGAGAGDRLRRRAREIAAASVLPVSLRPSKSAAAFYRLPGPCSPGLAVLGGLLQRWRQLCAAGGMRRLCPVLVSRLLFAALRGDALIRMLHGFAFDRLSWSRQRALARVVRASHPRGTR